ncbi:leucine-rich repeat protein, partial [Tannerella forsythia]
MKKKIFTLIMGLLLTALGAAAQNNGNAGPLTWNYNAGTKTLTITGEGEMPDYAYGGGTDRPWQTFKDEIETVTIGHGVTTVGQSAFTRCSKLQSITLPATLTKIGSHGFSRCTALQSITLPAVLTKIDDYAFIECSALTTFEVDPGNARYTATDGVLYNKAKTILRNYPAGKAATSFSVPAGVTYIGAYAFEAAAKLQSITLPAGVESIGEHAFHGCTTLQSIALPEGLTTIGKYAFHNCTALQSITLPASLTHIRNDAFSRCTALESITLPAALTDIDGSAFFNCTALTAIGVDAGNARFTSADGVLYNKAKTELVRYPAGKPGTAFTVPAEVKKIGNNAFGNCKLQSITLPAGLTTIGKYAFLDCTALQSIAIPAAVTSIEDYAFVDCTALTEVTVAWDTPLDIPPYVFHRVTLSNVTLRVPAGKMPAYQAEAVWKNFGTITDGVLFFLAVSPATLSFVAAGETKPVTVTASGAWTAASDQSW